MPGTRCVYPVLYVRHRVSHPVTSVPGFCGGKVGVFSSLPQWRINLFSVLEMAVFGGDPGVGGEMFQDLRKYVISFWSVIYGYLCGLGRLYNGMSGIVFAI